MVTYIQELMDKTFSHPIVIFGLVGQLVFMSRFIVQWVASERARKSVIPVAFWHLSLIGSVMVLIYGLVDVDPVVIAGQAFGFVVYFRNLYLIYTHQSKQADTPT